MPSIASWLIGRRRGNIHGVYPVVVVHVHEDGHGLTEDDARPHDRVANLAIHEGQRREDPQRNLGGRRREGGKTSQVL